jgi:hypothetical protein
MSDEFIIEAFCDALNSLKPGWVITNRGITGPAGALIRFAQRHESQSECHVDVQFILDESSDSEGHLWDCVSGFGDIPVARARAAAHLWSSTTGAALLELKFSRRGEYADHYRGRDANGFVGWHIICGAILGFGHERSPEELQTWWLNHPVLPRIAGALDESLSDEACPHGVKILFGGNGVAEVRINGELHPAASKALADLPWPRISPPGFVRTYVVLLHRDR